MNLVRYITIWVAFGPSIRDLASDSFPVREAAEARLSYYSDLCYPILPINSPDLEVRLRSRRILSRTTPTNPPAIALMCASPVPEWVNPTSSECTTGRIGTCPGPDWRLAWLRPNYMYKPPPLFSLTHLVNHYGERTRTQHTWKDWQSEADGRAATRLLFSDLHTIGCPPILMRSINDYLVSRESALYYPPGSAWIGR